LGKGGPLKQKLFLLSLILIPLVFFLSLEGALRLVGYGTSYELFHSTDTELITNPDFPGKYFTNQVVGIPQVIEQKIPHHKTKNTIRIICLGGSTMAGFPYEVNINLPFFLRSYLQKSFPDYRFEVLNLGISAINSFSVLDMLPRVAALNPDMILIYMGHNEFYGALGAASTENFGQNRFLIRLLLGLKNWRTYQLLQNGLSWLVSLLHSKEHTQKPATLMQAMIGKDHIDPSGPVFKKTIENFQANLAAILSFWNQRRIPVILSDLTSNLKDQPPLGAIRNPKVQAAISKLDALQPGQELRAVQTLKILQKKYPREAHLHYRLGRILFSLGRYRQARRQFLLARDLDTLPFRAPDTLNRVIRRLARRHGVLLVSADSVFRAHSAHGITDHTLFLEHLHPNQRGYLLLTHVFVNPVTRWLKTRLHLSSTLPDSIPVCYTDLDLAIGQAKIRNLLTHPPFEGQTVFKPTVFPSTAIRNLVRLHLTQGLYWDAAHLELGKWYLNQKKPEQAGREFSAILCADSTQVSALNYQGDVYFARSQFAKALYFYRKALSLTPQAWYLQAKIGKTLIVSNRNRQGILTLRALLKKSSIEKEMNKSQRAELHYLLALGLARQGQYEWAESEIQSALTLRKDYTPALQLQKQIVPLK